MAGAVRLPRGDRGGLRRDRRPAAGPAPFAAARSVPARPRRPVQPYFDRPGEFGVTLEPLPAYRHIYAGDDAVRARLGYHFAMRSAALDGIAEYAATSAREYRDWQAHQAASALWIEAGVVHDRRWGWPAADHLLDPAQSALLDLAWHIVPWVRVLADLPHDAPALEAAAESLAARGWLLREAGQVLSLPLRQPGFRAAPSIAGIRDAIGLPLATAAE